MGSENGQMISILQAVRDEGDATKREVQGLEQVLTSGFKQLSLDMQANTSETKLMRESLVSGLMDVIKVLCYLLGAVVIWVTGIKTLAPIFEKALHL